MKEITLPRKVTFVRHGHYDGNIYGDAGLSPEQLRERDQTVGLDKLGIRQAKKLRRTIFRRFFPRISRPDFIISSPTRRTEETAQRSLPKAWLRRTGGIIYDPRAAEQNKGTDHEDHYDDNNLLRRSYPGGETLYETGRRLLDLLSQPEFADKEVIVFSHARAMLAARLLLGRLDYVTLRDHGLPNAIDGIYINNAQIETYERKINPITKELPAWFTQMEVEETWEDNPKKSGVIYIATP